MKVFELWLRRWEDLSYVVTYVQAADEADALCLTEDEAMRDTWQLKAIHEITTPVQYDIFEQVVNIEDVYNWGDILKCGCRSMNARITSGVDWMSTIANRCSVI